MNGVLYALLLDGCLASATLWAARKNTTIEGRRVSSLPAYHLRFPRPEEYLEGEAKLKRRYRRFSYPASHLPQSLSFAYRTKGQPKKFTPEGVDEMQSRLERLKSYVGQAPPKSRFDGFYRNNAGRFLRQVDGKLAASSELLLAEAEFKSLEPTLRSRLALLKVVAIESARPTCQFVYDLSAPGKENFLAGFGGLFCHNTGSGKSTTAAVMVRQVASMGLPVMILDWHNEHAGLVKSVGGQVLSPGKDDFAINTLDLGPATEPAEHIEMVTDIFCDTYVFSHPQGYMFRFALQRCLAEATDREVPTLASLVSTIESYPLRSAYDNETKVALLRRLVPLTQGGVGRAFNSPSSHTVDELLDKVLCVELGHIRETQSRSIFADILMKLIYELRLSRKVRMEHLTMVEEARNIAPARRDEDPPSVGERMISELRKFGESMLFVAQFPSQVASEVVKNSGVRIIHRVAWAEDLRLIRDSLSLTPEQLSYVSTLGVGEVVVSLTRLQKPILVQVEAGGSLSPERRDLNLLEES
jgi:hypothetical protein